MLQRHGANLGMGMNGRLCLMMSARYSAQRLLLQRRNAVIACPEFNLACFERRSLQPFFHLPDDEIRQLVDAFASIHWA